MKKIIPIRISPEMNQRLKDACEREGVDKSSLVVSYVYHFVTQVEGGKKPDIIDPEIANQDFNKSTIIQVKISPVLKERFEQALEKTGLEASSLILAYLIQFIKDSEERRQ